MNGRRYGVRLYTSRKTNTDERSVADDGVHLTKAGYELMGDTIADRLIEITQELKPTGVYSQTQAHQSTVSETTGRANIKDLGPLYSNPYPTNFSQK